VERAIADYGRGASVGIVLGIVLGIALHCGVAKADSGDVSFGIGATYAVPKQEARVDARIQYGLSQSLSLRGQAGAGFSDAGTRALLSAGLVYAYDIVTWVPEIGVYGGVSLGDGYHHARALALAGVRRYVSRTTSIGVSAGVEYDWAPFDQDHVRALIDVTLWL
jgi:hypothetical protein